MTLKASWETNFFTVSFVDSDGGSLVAPQKVISGQKAQAPEVPTKENLAFDGWLLSGQPYDFDAPVTSDLTLTASWTNEFYTVTFLNGGDRNIPQQRIPHNGFAAEPTPIRKGYVFDGWQREDGEDFDFAAPVTQDMALTARWIQNSGYSVSLFLTEHGMIPEDYYEDDSVKIAQNAPYEYELNYVRGSVELPLLFDIMEADACYTFAGWRQTGSHEQPSLHVSVKERNGSYEAVWSEGVREGALKLDADADSAFQGLWNPATGEGEEVADAMVSTGMDLRELQTPAQRVAEVMRELACVYGEGKDDTVSIQIEIRERAEDAQDANQIAIQQMARQGSNLSGVSFKFSFLDIGVNLMINGQDNGFVSDEGRVIELPFSYDLSGLYNPAFYRALYSTKVAEPLSRLNARQTSDNLKEGYYIEGSGENAIVYLYMNASNSALYSLAAQDKAAYTVTFDSNGGSAVSAQQTTGAATRPTNPTRSGYNFVGWYTARTGGTLFDFTAPVSADTTVYARWTQKSSGSSSGSSSSRSSGSSSSGSQVTYYPVTVKQTEHGSVTASRKTAAENAKVTLTIKADNGYKADAVTVTTSAGKNVDVTKNDNGKWTYLQANGGATVSVTFISEDSGDTTSVPATDSGNENGNENRFNFTDVMPDKYYYDAVAWAVAQGITQGRTATTFEPDASCTRAQTVTFLWRAAGMPEPQSSENPFNDVVAGSYYEKAALWAVEQGITKGVTSVAFHPDDTVNRGQMVTFLFRAAKAPEGNGRAIYADVAESAYYYDAVTWAAETGVTQGKTATTFAPKQPCTRAQIVTFLYRNNLNKQVA